MQRLAAMMARAPVSWRGKHCVAWLLLSVPVPVSPATEIDLSVPPRVGIGAWHRASPFDFDADGNPDVAVTGDSSVSIFSTRPSGDLELLGKFDIQGVDGRVTLNDVIDLNADGFPELFVGWSRLSGGCVRGPLILLWNDNNQTGEQVTLPSTYESRAVAADLDGDTDLDLVLSTTVCEPGFDVGHIDVLMRDGERTFAPATRYFPHTNPPPGPIDVVDFTGDGRPDVIAVSWGRVFPNLGGGILGPPIQFDIAERRSFVSTADLHPDGWADIATATDRRLQLYGNTGQGSFRAGSIPTAPGLVAEVHDLDLDGDTDFVLTTYDDVQLVHNRGNGSFDPLTLSLSRSNGSDAPLVVDFNNDHHLDLLVRRSRLVLSTGSTYALGPVLAMHNSTAGVRSIDWDADGNLDLVTQASPDEAFLVRGLENGDFVVPVQVDLDSGSPLIAADFNRDRVPDLLVGKEGAVRLFLATASGFVMGPGGTIPIPNGTPRDAAVADFNKDGILDVAIAATSTSDGGLCVFRSATEALASVQTHATGTTPRTVVTGDFDGDGWVDVACNGWLAFLLVLYNHQGTLQAPVFLAADTPVDLAAADLDADGRTDVVLVTDNGELRILYGAERGVFDTATVASGYGDAVHASDLNTDGVPDIAGAVGQDVAVFLNRGARRFDATLPANAVRTAVSFSAGDLDADGLADLIAFGPTTGPERGFTLLENLGGGSFAAGVSDDFTASRGVLVDWTRDGRLDLLTENRLLYLNRTEATTPVALLDGSAAWRGGAIVLEWSLAGVLPGSTLELLRSVEREGPYALAGRVEPAVAGRVEFSDTDVDPSHAYWYRIGLVLPQGQRQVLAEIRVAELGRQTAGLQAIENHGERSVRFRYTVARSGSPVSLDIYDVRGRRLRTLVLGPRSEGTHVIAWDGTDPGGGRAGRGIYFVRFTSGNVRHARQFALQ